MLGAADNKDWLWITDRHDYVLWLGGTVQPKIKNSYFSHYLYLVSGYLSTQGVLVGVAEFGRF